MDLKNKQTKAILIGTLIGGLVYAALMTLFDYSNRQDLQYWKIFSKLYLFWDIYGLVNLL